MHEGYSTPGYLTPPPAGAQYPDAPDRSAMGPLGSQGTMMDIVDAQRRPQSPVRDPVQMMAAQQRLDDMKRKAEALRRFGERTR